MAGRLWLRCRKAAPRGRYWGASWLKEGRLALGLSNRATWCEQTGREPGATDEATLGWAVLGMICTSCF